MDIIIMMDDVSCWESRSRKQMAKLTTTTIDRERRGCFVSRFRFRFIEKALLFTTMKQPVSDPTTTMAVSSPSKLIVRIRRKSSARNRSFNMQDQEPEPEKEVTDEPNSNSNSPYYKGLTDQSLAILDDTAAASSSSSSLSPSPPPYSYSNSSPYYKGLTDNTLAIPSPNSPAHHNNIINPFSNSNTHHESSPYYRGLTDYSLALHGSTSNSTHSHAHGPLMEEDKLESAPPILEEDVSLEIQQEKPLTLREDSSGFRDQESKVEAISEEEETIMMDFMTTDDDDVIQEKKPLRLRERVSELEASNAEEGHVYQYTWATKHQPLTLQDFICNRDKALHLQALVRVSYTPTC